MKVINTLENMDLSTSNLVGSYWASDILNDIYFIPKKIDKQKICNLVKDDEFLKLLKITISFLKKCDVIKVIEELFHEFENDTKYQLKDEKLYLILGYHTTTIYSTVVNSEEISVLCLESLEGNLDKLKMLLAHEFTHYIRKRLLDCDIFEGCIGERIVTEGIASNYSREMVSSKVANAYNDYMQETNSSLLLESEVLTYKHSPRDGNVPYTMAYVNDSHNYVYLPSNEKLSDFIWSQMDILLCYGADGSLVEDISNEKALDYAKVGTTELNEMAISDFTYEQKLGSPVLVISEHEKEISDTNNAKTNATYVNSRDNSDKGDEDR